MHGCVLACKHACILYYIHACICACVCICTMCVYVYTCPYVGVYLIIYCCVTASSVYLWVRMAVSSSFDDRSLSSYPYSIYDHDSSKKTQYNEYV